jgi:hypothetical protein
MKPYISDLDMLSARERYNDHLRAARQHKLVREVQLAQSLAAQPERPRSLLARLRAALLTRRPARASR